MNKALTITGWGFVFAHHAGIGVENLITQIKVAQCNPAFP